MSKAAILRLLRFTTKYDMKLKKNEGVTPGTMEINLHPSDYERDGGHSLQVSVFDTLSKTHLLVDTSGNISAFLAMWKKKGLRAAVEGGKLKYELPEVPTDKVLLNRIDVGVTKLLEHFSVGAPRADVGPKAGEEGESGGTKLKVGKKAGEEGESGGTEEEGEEAKANGNGNGNRNGGGGDD